MKYKGVAPWLWLSFTAQRVGGRARLGTEYPLYYESQSHCPTTPLYFTRRPRVLVTRALHPSNLDIGYCKKVGDIGIWNLDIEYYPLKMGYQDIGFTEIWILGHWFHHNYPFFPPLVRPVEDTNVLKSGYRDIGPPGAGPWYYRLFQDWTGAPTVAPPPSSLTLTMGPSAQARYSDNLLQPVRFCKIRSDTAT